MWLQIVVISIVALALFPGLRRWVMRRAGRTLAIVGLIALGVLAVIAFSHG
ncbi:MAG: hypothetical protein KDA49_08785 [Rhodospirillaceae bacterium]|nr:hypothetical protein [Rhodospirillaceae bacterium]